MWAHITIMGLSVVAVKQYCSVAHVNAGIPPPPCTKVFPNAPEKSTYSTLGGIDTNLLLKPQSCTVTGNNSDNGYLHN